MERGSQERTSDDQVPQPACLGLPSIPAITTTLPGLPPQPGCHLGLEPVFLRLCPLQLTPSRQSPPDLPQQCSIHCHCSQRETKPKPLYSTFSPGTTASSCFSVPRCTTTSGKNCLICVFALLHSLVNRLQSGFCPNTPSKLCLLMTPVSRVHCSAQNAPEAPHFLRPESQSFHCSAPPPIASLSSYLSPPCSFCCSHHGVWLALQPSRHTPTLPLWLELFSQMAASLTAFKLNKRKAGPDLQRLAWLTQLGLGALLLNIYSFTEHQCQTRPLCDHDGLRQTGPLCSDV